MFQDNFSDSLVNNSLPIREGCVVRSPECDDGFRPLDSQNEDFLQAWDVNTDSIIKF